eukprot:2029026-Rhodomonas_salina.1
MSEVMVEVDAKLDKASQSSQPIRRITSRLTATHQYSLSEHAFTLPFSTLQHKSLPAAPSSPAFQALLSPAGNQLMW